MRKYFKEILTLKYFVSLLLLILILSYSVYLFLDEKMVARLGDEDNLFEWATALCFLAASVISLLTYRIKKNLWFLLFALVFFVGFGEEISWGQRIIGFRTPEKLEQINVQREFSLHNIEVLNPSSFSGNYKHGLSKLLEINFLFKVFMIMYGMVLPVLTFHVTALRRIARRIKLPVPPFSIGVVFMFNWLIFKLLLSYFLPSGYDIQYYDSDTEIFEFVSSAIVMFFSLYFQVFKDFDPTLDIKFQLPERKTVFAIPDLAVYFRRAILLLVRRTF